MKELDKIGNNFSMFQLDLGKIPKLCGKQANRLLNEYFKIMTFSRYPLFFRGPAGTGKTTMGLNLVAKYAKQHNVPGFFVQISPEQTKSTLIIGKRLIAGTLKTVKGSVAYAAEMGAPILVDECTQGTPEVLANMQQLLERTGMLTDGDEIVYAKDTFRIIFCANPTKTHAVNVPLPTAFATRLMGFEFDFPDFEEELEITKEILADREFNMLPNEVPEPVMRYVISLMRAHRSGAYPIGPRNSAMCVSLLNILNHESGELKRAGKSLEDTFRRELGLSSNQNLEGRLSSIYARIHGEQPPSTVALIEDPGVMRFLEFVCHLGVNQFREAVKSTFMVNLDIDSFAIDTDKVKQNIVSSIL